MRRIEAKPENRVDGAYKPLTIKIYSRRTGRTVSEKTLITINTTNDRVIAAGTEAERYLQESSDELITVNPFKNGVVADFDVAATLLKRILIREELLRSSLRRMLRPVTAVWCFPMELTEVECIAAHDCIMNCGVSDCLVMGETSFDKALPELGEKYELVIGIIAEE